MQQYTASIDQQPPSALTVEELAAMYQLGVSYGPYRYRTIYQFATFITLVIVGAALLLVVWLFASSAIRDLSFGNTGPAIFNIVFGLVFGLVVLLFLWIGIKGLIATSRNRATLIHLYREGLIIAGGSKRVVVRWDEVSAFWQSITQRFVNGLPTKTTYFYRLQTTDNREFAFGDNITDIEQLGKLLSREITRTHLPGVLAAYEAGETVTFGKFSVNKQGISNGRETLPWDTIEGIKVQTGKIIVKKRRQWLLNWSTALVADTPNVLVFVALVSAILEQHSKSLP